MPEILRGQYLTLQHRAFINPSETVFVFPGQGFQQVGRGKQLYDYSEAAKKVFNIADEVVAPAGYSVSDISFKGPKDTLDQTRFSQPVILTLNEAYYEAIREELGDAFKDPSALAGLSLGELSAIRAARSIGFKPMLQVVDSRGEEMQRICDANPGGKLMVTIRVKGEEGLSLRHRIILGRAIRYLTKSDELEEDDRLIVGSINTDVSISLGGSKRALQKAEVWLKQYKRSGNEEITWIRIPVKGPFHTPAMKGAEKGVKEVLDKVDIADPQIPVIANTDGSILTTAEAVRAEIIPHISSPVRWYKSIRVLYKNGARFIVEPGDQPNVLWTIQRDNYVTVPVRGDYGKGIVLAHISLPREEL